MRRFGLIVLLLFLLLALPFMYKGNISEVKASPDIYQGDLVLTGNDVYVIEGRFDINGSIIVEENATLILQNAIVNLTQSENYEHNMTLRNPVNGNPRLQSTNSTITSNLEWFMVVLYDNSSATMTNSIDTAYLRTFGSANVSVSNSTIKLFDVIGPSVVTISNSTISYGLVAHYYSVVSVSNSTIEKLTIRSMHVNCSMAKIVPGPLTFWNYLLNSSVTVAPSGWAPNVTIRNSNVNGWNPDFEESSNATITDSELCHLSSKDSNVWCINTTAILYIIHMEGKVYVSWYLDAHVIDSIGQDVPSANVTAAYPNATIAESKLTNANGLARLTVMEKMMNSTGDYPVGNYTIEASYGTHFNSTTVNMTGNREITLSLDFVIPEFPSLLILPLFMTATLLAVIVCRRKRISIG